jgi:hypothetical protein
MVNNLLPRSDDSDDKGGVLSGRSILILFMDERKGFRIVFFWLFTGWGL